MKRREFLAAAAAVAVQTYTGRCDESTPGGKAMNSSLLAGVAARGIVPDPDLVNNSLHSNMTVRFDERGSELRAKALSLQFGRTKRLLLALDIVYVSNPHAERMRQAIARATGLPQDEVVITASHSHSTPFLEPFTGRQPYFDFVLQRSVEAAEEAMRQLRPARLGWGITHSTRASHWTTEA
jgi:hypothetical protein